MAVKIISFCISAFRAIPVIFITAVIVWSYYAYVFQMCIFTIDSIAQKVLYLIFYHIFLFFVLWSYWKTIFTPIALPPYEFYIGNNEFVASSIMSPGAEKKKIINSFASTLGVQCRISNGDARFCDKCNCIKPDRAHHCSVCGKCILKLDHHCPWVNNCICFSNYKFFILFLFYGDLYCLYIFSTSLQYFLIFWRAVSNVNENLGNLNIVFLFFASVMFFFSSFALFSYHCYLIFINRTTIETFQVPIFVNNVKDADAYNLGYKTNFKEVFGDRKLFWFLPINTTRGDGIHYPTRFSNQNNTYNTMETNVNNHNIGNHDNRSTVLNMDLKDQNFQTQQQQIYNQPYNQPINQPYNQPINQPYNQPINQPYNQLINQPYNQPINQPYDQSFNQQKQPIHSLPSPFLSTSNQKQNIYNDTNKLLNEKNNLLPENIVQ